MHSKSILLVHIVACLISLALAGCHQRPDLVDTLGTATGCQPGPTIWDHDARELAPIIVVASVQENRVVSKHLEAAHYEGVYLDLHEVRCKRENSLKGGLTGPEVRFFYFADGRYTDTKPNPCYKLLFEAEPGSRYLFFLTRDRGELRSIGDVGNYSILVSTGTHPESSAGDVDTTRLMPEILLTPGNGADLNLMTKKLVEYSTIADRWGSRPRTVELLRRLTSLPEPLRFQACGMLMAFYHGQDDCLQAIAEDSGESPENRQDAARELEKQGPARQRLLDSLKDPARFTYLDWAGDSRRRLQEELETMLLGTDVALQELVCTALKRYYPYDAEPRCPAAKENTAGRNGR